MYADYKKNRQWFLLLSIIFLFSLLLFNWPHYIDDTDDVLTVAYHFWGRNKIIQSPYNMYDSMCDYLLSFLPRNYHLLYTAMVLWTFLSGIAVFLLLIEITKNFLPDSGYNPYLYGFLLLFAIPEFDYLILSYKSSLIGFSFILFSHYILLAKYKKAKTVSISAILLSATLFAFGTACRWSLIIYGFPLLADIAYLLYRKQKIFAARALLLWCITAFLCFILFLFISGYNLVDFFRIVVWGKNMITLHQNHLIYNLATATTLFTPVALLAFISGITILCRHYKQYTRIWIFIIFSSIPYFYLTFIPNLKFLITLFPALVITLFIGFNFIYKSGSTISNFLKIAIPILLLLPWFIGIKLYTNFTLWGPGFNVKENSVVANTSNQSLDKRFNIQSIKIVPDAGFAISSTEGNRPLWGYFYTLFCGGLYRLDEELANQAQETIDLSAQEHIPIYTDYAYKMNPSIIDALCRNNYQTTDSEMNTGDLTQRIFFNSTDTVLIKAFNNPEQTENFDKLKQLFPDHYFIAAFTYSSLLTDFMYKAPMHGITIRKPLNIFDCEFYIK